MKKIERAKRIDLSEQCGFRWSQEVVAQEFSVDCASPFRLHNYGISFAVCSRAGKHLLVAL